MAGVNVYKTLAVLAGLLLLAAPALAAERVALVVGNAAYHEADAKLKNPVNDATAVASALRRMGFQVIMGTDLDREAFFDKIIEFEDASSSAELSLFFYAGHGLQVEGRNYLGPVDMRLARKQDLSRRAITLAEVTEVMRGQTNLVILDACRNNPLARGLARSLGVSRAVAASRGLARVESSGEMLIAYATEPGDVAADGTGRHSPYTAALLEHLETPGQSVNDLFVAVTGSVKRRTSDRQKPWTNSSLSKVVRLVPGSEGGTTAVVPPPPPSPDLSPQTVEAGLKLTRAEQRLLQWGLKAAGHDPGAVDGLIGPGTRAALRRWQGSRGKEETGYLDAESVRLLVAVGRELEGKEEARRAEAEAQRGRREGQAAEKARREAEEKARKEAEARYRRPFGPKWVVAENQTCQVHKPEMEPGGTFTVTWSGGCLDGKASGEGRLVWQHNENSGVYEGQFRNGKLHGQGTLTWGNGDRYEGRWGNARPHGRGTLTLAGGDRYRGRWRNGCYGNRRGRWTFVETTAEACGFK